MTNCSNNVFLIGIGGMGMCPLAIYLTDIGYTVSGIDDSLRDDVRQLLLSKGVTLCPTPSIPDTCQTVIYSSAIKTTHPLYQQAKGRGLPLIRRGQFLADLLKDKKLLAIIGSHGKTTTLGMLVHALKQAHFPTSHMLGALFKDNTLMPAAAIDSEWVVAEIDESDGTIEAFSPEITLAINFDWDHPDRYKTAQDLEAAYSKIFSQTHGSLIIPQECLVLQTLAQKSGKPIHTFSSSTITLYQPGDFNRSNAAATLCATQLLAQQSDESLLNNFSGIKRRQDVLHDQDNLYVMMDYAHHPTEVDALLKHVSLTHKAPTIAVFQPHRYTRTEKYFQEFAQVLNQADHVLLLPVYAASEEPTEAGKTDAIYNELLKLKDSSEVSLLPFASNPLFEALQHITEKYKSQPLNILFIGAGDIENLAIAYKKLLSLNAWWQALHEKLLPDTKLTTFETLYNKTTIRIGGKASFYAEPASAEDLSLLLKDAKRVDCPVYILGRGSNLIVDDAGFPGLVIRLNHAYWKAMDSIDDEHMYARAGVRLKEICGYAAKLGITGFEFIEGIPGSLGGSLRMNAGAMGGWLFDVVESVEYMTYDGDIIKKNKNDFTLGYRYCKELQSAIAIGAVLKGTEKTDETMVRNKINEFANHRKGTQPRESSAGCIFKNPEGNHAGKLIEQSGLKGLSVGDAEVSTVHANFIINRGKASSDDVVNLVRKVRHEVKAATGIELEPEVLVLGKTWTDILSNS